MAKNERVAVYPGSFDPITLGHIDIIQRALKIFDRLVILVLENPRKEAMLFSTKEKMDMIKISTKNMKNVEIDSFEGLLVGYLKKRKIDFVIRGMRALSDFDFEFQMAMVNKSLDPSMETVFIMTDKQYFYLNSSTIRELAKYGASINGMVPKEIEGMVKKKFVE